MLTRLFALLLALTVVGCTESDPPLRRWDQIYDGYMSSRGYTMASDNETILKNGYPIWVDEVCFGRGCVGNYPLIPYELVPGVRADFFAAVKYAKESYVNDVSSKIGINPEPPVTEPEFHH